MSKGARKKALYGAICAYNIGKTLTRNGGKKMWERFNNWIGQILEVYGIGILAFVGIALVIGVIVEKLKRAFFKVLDEKYADSTLVHVCKVAFATLTAAGLEAILFIPALTHLEYVGAPYTYGAWFVGMFLFQELLDMKAVKNFWNWCIMRKNSPKAEKVDQPKMKKIKVTEYNAETGAYETKIVLVPKDTVVTKAAQV